MAVKWHNRYSNPVENMRSYIRVHEGLDRHDRMLDVDNIEQKLEAAEQLAWILTFGWLLMTKETRQEEWDDWVEKTKNALMEYEAI